MAPVGTAAQSNQAEPVLTRLVQEDKTPWYRKKNLRVLYMLLLPTCIGIEMTSGFDSQMINTVQISNHWQTYFEHPEGALLGIISAAYNLGAICALPFVPFVNDKFGRRWAIFFGSWVMVFGAFLQAFSNGPAMYIIARWFLGFGIPYCIIAGSSLMGELAYPKERPIMTSLFNALYFVGSLVAAGISFGTQQIGNDWAWRIPSLLQAGPSLIQIIFIFMIPESPRFLISKDRRDEAFAILVKYHAEGNPDSEFVKAEMTQIETTIKIELEHSQRSWWEMVATPGMRKRVVIGSFLGLFTQWSGNTLISYYLNDLLKLIGYTNANFKNKLNVGLNSWSLVNAVCISLLVRRFPRRVMYMTCTLALLCCYVGWTVSMQQFMEHKGAAAAKVTIFFIFAYSPCYNIGYNALTYTYLVELFPFAQRAKGITIFQFFGRGAGFFTTFVNPIGLKNIQWKWLVTYCCWLAFENVFVYFMFPETYGRTLEELAFLFEDRARADEATMRVEKQIHHEDNGVYDGRHATVPRKGV
ncbi:hexose transporter-like protein [Aaosphaeria arxii CBS 175.79]|uniref:Hexose transporter-like protein n=1 Tax=Aaosphaeria arxii CBS 175.79 TaxID=1450172 RepID=A0A6A5X9A9_9PLEO|nr:hexose transporter-like protein [Aaosphaeria arxii CBS 175.79]KAF2009645.1 hexose transporter-like protein [Aaosphaeria arxii CBS 175.79]